MSSSSNHAVKNSEQPAKPATLFNQNPPTDDATDGGALATYRIDFYFANYNAGIPSSRGQESVAGPGAGLAELEADMAAFRDPTNAPAGCPIRPET